MSKSRSFELYARRIFSQLEFQSFSTAWQVSTHTLPPSYSNLSFPQCHVPIAAENIGLYPPEFSIALGDSLGFGKSLRGAGSRRGISIRYMVPAVKSSFCLVLYAESVHSSPFFPALFLVTILLPFHDTQPSYLAPAHIIYAYSEYHGYAHTYRQHTLYLPKGL